MYLLPFLFIHSKAEVKEFMCSQVPKRSGFKPAHSNTRIYIFSDYIPLNIEILFKVLCQNKVVSIDREIGTFIY